MRRRRTAGAGVPIGWRFWLAQGRRSGDGLAGCEIGVILGQLLIYGISDQTCQPQEKYRRSPNGVRRRTDLLHHYFVADAKQA